MSKQDGYSPRTAADLERKYNFGKSFAEVYGLASDAKRAADDAKRAADDAQSAFDGLDQEQIFNLLTNYGEEQGIYRDNNDHVYINASYIKSGKLAADYIDTQGLKVSISNVDGLKGELDLKLGYNDNDQIVSMLNASADQINITSDEMTIKSTGFELENGEMTAIKGTIGGWVVGWDDDLGMSVMRSPNGVLGRISWTSTGTDLRYVEGCIFTVLTPKGLAYVVKSGSDYSSSTVSTMFALETLGCTFTSYELGNDNS